jgi:hypothetical protein
VLINCKSCLCIMNVMISNANEERMLELFFYEFVVPGYFLVDSLNS